MTNGWTVSGVIRALRSRFDLPANSGLRAFTSPLLNSVHTHMPIEAVAQEARQGRGDRTNGPGPQRYLAASFPLLFCLCLFGYTCIFNGVRIDDAYITASYARTLATTGTWGMHPGFTSNAATSPLNVIVLAALVRFGMSALMAQSVLNGILIGITLATLLKLSRLIFASDLWAYASTLLLFTNPLLISTSGLESYLYVTLILVCCLAYLMHHFFWLGCSCGLLVLARQDGILLVLIITTFLLYEERKSMLAFLAPMVALVATWEMYSWRILGSLVPDTFFIKRIQTDWNGVGFSDGWKLYLHNRPVPTALSMVLVLAVPLAIALARDNRKWLRFSSLAGGATILHAVSYSALRVPPYHWYYAQECATFVVLGSAGLLYGWQQLSARRWPALTVFGLVAAASVGEGFAAVHRMNATPISSNWADAAQYRTIASWINDHSSVRSYRIIGELGALQYYSRAEAVNEFSDRSVVILIRDRPSKVPFWLRRANNLYFRAPSLSAGTELTSECVPGQSYEKTWLTHSPWRGDHEWCWGSSALHPASKP
jgi:hypothetical protein